MSWRNFATRDAFYLLADIRQHETLSPKAIRILTSAIRHLLES